MSAAQCLSRDVLAKALAKVSRVFLLYCTFMSEASSGALPEIKIIDVLNGRNPRNSV
jgi:hypothetical protein